MKSNQQVLRELRSEKSRVTQTMAEYAGLTEPTAEQRQSFDDAEKSIPDLERRIRAAELACAADDDQATDRVDTESTPKGNRERLELRSRCRVGNYLRAILERRPVEGAEAELREELKLGHNSIPIELWETRADAPTDSPSTGTGVNLRPIFPRLLANSVANSFLGISMPTVGTGQYSTLRQDTGLTASALGKGDAAMSTAATYAAASSDPHRVSARLSIRIEDKAMIGTDSFESSLRSNLANQLSAELDRLALVGDPGTNADEPQGIIGRLNDPADPTAVAGFDDFISLFADAIDSGPFAMSMMDVRCLSNADVARLAATTFRDRVIDGSGKAAVSLGSVTAADYLMAHSGGLMSHSRMPATAATIATVIRCRLNARAMGENSITYAECPVWAGIEMVVDPYTDSASATTHFTSHMLIGDVILIQPSAYERVDLKVA